MQIMKSTEIIIYTRNYLLYNDFISLSWYLFILLLVYALTIGVIACQRKMIRESPAGHESMRHGGF